MQLFAGLDVTDYADLLRALGRDLDAADARDLRLVEVDDGLTVQTRPNTRGAAFETVHYPDDALLALLRSAYARRGHQEQSPPRNAPLGLPYEQVLRTLGSLADRGSLRSLRIVEQPGGVLIQGVPGGILRRGYQTHRPTSEQLREAAIALQRGEPPTLPQVSSEA